MPQTSNNKLLLGSMQFVCRSATSLICHTITKYIGLFSHMGSFLSKEELETAVGEWLQVSVMSERTAVGEWLLVSVMSKRTAVGEWLLASVMSERTAVGEWLLVSVMSERTSVGEWLLVSVMSERTPR